MGKEWTEATLGQAAEVIMGQSPPGSTYNDQGEGLPFLQGSAEFGPSYPVPIKWCSAPARIAEEGDILLSIRAPVGDVNTAHQRLAVGRGLAIVRGTEQATSAFLALVLEYSRDALLQRSGTGMFASITKSGLLGLRVPLPPLADQHRIVETLAAVDETWDGVQHEIDVARQTYNAVLVDLMRPFTVDGTMKPLGALAQTRLGKMLSGETRRGQDQSPYLRNANVQWDALQLDDLNAMHFSEEEKRELALQAGDVLVCEGGEAGRAAVLDRDLPGIFFQKAIHRVRCGPSLQPRFLLHYMKFCVFTGSLADFVTKHTIQHLTGEKLRRLPVPIPRRSVQEDTVTLLDSVLGVEYLALRVAEELAHVRLRLLTDLLTQRDRALEVSGVP